MKYQNKSFPFTSPRLRSIRILSALIRSLAMSGQYSQSNKALSHLMPLLKRKDNLEVFRWLVTVEIEKITTDKIFDYLNKLFPHETAMVYQVLLKLQSSPAEALGIVEAVKHT